MLPFILIYLAFTSVFFTPIMPLPQGAPTSVCDTMLPFHGGGIKPQNSTSPFSIVTPTTAVGQGQVLLIEIISNPPPLTFGGFMIHARTATPPYNVVGKFAPSGDGLFKLENCYGGEDNTATHVSPSPKNDLNLQWQAPVDFTGQVIFTATVAQTYAEFWVGIQSVPIEIVQRGVPLPPQFVPGGTSRRPFLPTNPPFIPERPQQEQYRDSIYDGCQSNTKLCFGFPDGCVNDETCQAIATILVLGDRYQFELKSGYNNPAYVAVGLSADDKMGHDSIMECVPEGGIVRAYTSWTLPRPNLGVTRIGVPQNIIRLLNGTYIDGTIYCKFERVTVSTVMDTVFDFTNDRYNIFVATGSSLKQNSVGYHNINKLSTSHKLSLNQRNNAPNQGGHNNNSNSGGVNGNAIGGNAIGGNAVGGNGLGVIGSQSIYESCRTNKKLCFGFPSGCIAQESCRAVTTVVAVGNRYQFEMQSGFNNPAYVAVGLSSDEIMGFDSVMECVPERGVVRAYTSWTLPRPNIGITRDGVPQQIIRLLDGSYVDGTIYCKIEREAVSTVKDTKFDLINDKYNLLLAIGTSLKENSVGYHGTEKLASSEKLSLSETGAVGGASKLLLRLHGAFMLTAWIGTASLGILLARYFKQTWVGSQTCGKDQWFVWHRTCMVLTWSLTMCAFVIIFIQLDGWSSEQNPHAILGTITTILCFIQPIGALFRPAPNAKNRPIFNWAHWFIGNLAHIFAVVTIFFAVKLAKAELPEWFDWILVAFVLFHVIVHIILSIAGCVSDKGNGQRVNSFPMVDPHHARGSIPKDRKLDAPFSTLRKIILTVYMVILIIFVIALVVIASLAPIGDAVSSIKTKLTN